MRILSGVLVLAMITAACGSDDGDPVAEAEPSPDATEESEEAEESAASDGPIDLRLAGSSPGGAAAVQMAGLAELLRQNMDEVVPTSMGSEGVTANVRLVEEGTAQGGAGSTVAMYNSLVGEADFEGDADYENWRAVAPILDIPLWGIASVDSGVESLADINDSHVVSLGPAGSGSGASWELALQGAGYDFEFVNLSFDETAAQMGDGQVDVFLHGVRGLAAGIEAETALRGEANWFGIEDTDDIAAAQEAAPALGDVHMAAGSFESQDRDIQTIGHSAAFIIHRDIPDDVVYRITELIHQEADFLSEHGWEHAEYDLLPGFALFEQMGGYLHAGAVQYWQDQGEDVPEALIE